MTYIDRAVLYPLTGISALSLAFRSFNGKSLSMAAMASAADGRQAFTFAAVRRDESEVFQKGPLPIFSSRTSTARPLSEATETDFEDDFSDEEAYSGRRSEYAVTSI